MAEKNKKADGTEMAVEIPVVAPINIGEGFKWDPTTKKYNIDITQQNARVGSGLIFGPNGAVNVALSKDPTNLLQMKPDGVYYGIKPPANIEELFVDAENGVDQNPDEVDGAGTVRKPLRTIQYAESLSIQGTHRKIRLHTEQEHNITPQRRVSFKSGSLTISPYGPAFDDALQQANGDWTHAVSILQDNGKAPKIKLSGVFVKVGPPRTKEYSYPDYLCIVLENGANLSLGGLYLINDLGARFEKHSQATTEEMRAGHLSRILNQVGTSVFLNRCKLLSVGEFSTYAFSNNSTMRWTKSVEGINTFVGGFFDPTAGELNFLNTNIDDSIKCFVVSHQGWNQPLSNLLSVSLSNTYNKDKFAKRVYGAKIDNQNGVKILLAPTSDVSATLFE